MVTITGSAADEAAGLMRLAADGDELAFARIVDAHHADMTSVCFVVTGGDAELTEEAVQSAWPIAWRKLGAVRDPARLRPWLVSIAVNEARQLLRGRRRQALHQGPLDASVEPGTPDLSFAISAIDLRKALARLSPDDRALLAMRYVA